MSSNRQKHEVLDLDEPPRTYRNSLIVSVCVNVGLSLLLVLGASGRGDRSVRAGTQGKATEKLADGTVLTRQQLSHLLVGRTQQEVLTILGRPDRTLGGGSPSDFSLWFYEPEDKLEGRLKWKVKDAVTGRMDRHVTIHITSDGIVKSAEAN